MHLMLQMPGVPESAGILDWQSPSIMAALWLGRMSENRHSAAEKRGSRVRVGEALVGGS
jgi:hypothetical protein